MIKDHSNLIEGDTCWAFAYSTTNTEKSMAIKAEPYFCEFVRPTRGYHRLELARISNGKTLTSGRVRPYSRMYADTYEEAVEAYNELVQEQIDMLNRLIESHEADKMEV